MSGCEKNSLEFHVREKDSVLAIGSPISGFTPGLIGVGGAIRSMFLISTFLKQAAYVATAATIAIMVDISRISVYIYRDALYQTGHTIDPCCFPGGFYR